MTVTALENSLIQAVLKFANLRHIKHTKQVEDLFGNHPWVGPYFKVIPLEDVEAYRNDQQRLREWLEGIAHNRKKVVSEVASLLKTKVDTAIIFNEDKQQIEFVYALSGVEACCSFVAALLLDKKRGLTKRLGLCDLKIEGKECGRFRFTAKGKPYKYCSASHSKEADKIKARRRVKLWRVYRQ